MPMIRLIAVFSIMVTISSVVFAGTGQGVVHSIRASTIAPYVMFDFTTPIENSHMCNRAKRFSIDTSGVGGKEAFETLLLAKRMGLRVFVQGLGTCNIYDAENVKHIQVQ
jgi:hypothetical protein